MNEDSVWSGGHQKSKPQSKPAKARHGHRKEATHPAMAGDSGYFFI
ncbi:MAG: hypothetical protein PUF63_10745 [Prevotella sp.]|nr:hypothetical protein [Prevotella sp.]